MQTPFMEVIRFDAADILTTSGGSNPPSTGWPYTLQTFDKTNWNSAPGAGHSNGVLVYGNGTEYADDYSADGAFQLGLGEPLTANTWYCGEDMSNLKQCDNPLAHLVTVPNGK